jgi:hypothetical protein
MSKFQIPQPKFGLILTGPKRLDLKMFGGPLEKIPVGRKIWTPGPILDQGNESACVGFGWTHFLTAEPMPFPAAKADFNFAMGVYREAQKLDQWEGEEPEYFGTSVEAGHEALARRKLIKPNIYWAKSISQIVKHVLELGPVVMGSNWYTDMMEPDANGYIHPKGHNEGGHCWTIYGVVNEASLKEVWMVNSWGFGWGNYGTAKITFSDLRRLLFMQGYGMSAMEEAGEVADDVIAPPTVP